MHISNPSEPTTESPETPTDFRGVGLSGTAFLGRLLIMLVFIGVIIASVHPTFTGDDAPLSDSWLMLSFLGVLFAYTFRKLWLAWRDPPHIRLTPQQIRLQNAGLLVETPTSNIVDLSLSAGSLCVRFRDLAAIQASNAARIRRIFESTFRVSGWHYVMPRGAFDFGQANDLRYALGLGAQHHDERESNLSAFSRGLKRTTPRTWMTTSLITINVLVFVSLLVAASHDPSTQNASWYERLHLFSNLPPDVIVHWGGNLPSLTTHGELWRMLSCVFLHWTVIHLLFNMWVLNDVGRYVERVYGQLPYLCVYLFSGLCGSLATIYWGLWSQSVISAGASGAVFGMFGWLLGLVLRRPSEFPAERLRHLKMVCLNFVILNLMFGMTMKHIDMAAHVGGLLGGFVCGWIAIPLLPTRPFSSLFTRLAGVVPLCAVILTVAIVTLPRVSTEFTWEMTKFFAFQERSLARFDELNRELKAGTAPATVADDLERSVAEPWREESQRLAAIIDIAPRDRDAWQALLKYSDRLAKSFALKADAIRTQDFQKLEESLKQEQQASEELKNWVERDGKRYGLSMVEKSTPATEQE